uniref:acetyl-CoA carboxylase carboxyltransferase beta subunit n=1 Tax=Opuntia ficus-indica TaxID=371859 RepID=UPI002E7765CC|nr:acetyl-CoA carboxylase carboxyltransferase beta subunit [Opuntia ficus-indica]WRH31583.1 acetyl-CoA carboxylase carboxyltransferase beta subunit [Opuntia ficus-indica]
MTLIFNLINQPFVKKGRLPFLELKRNLGHKYKSLINATENSGSLDEKNFSAEDTRISDTESLGWIPENRGIDNIILTKNPGEEVNNMEKRDLERDVNQKTDGTENITETDGMRKFAHLWVPCENCYNLHYKKCFNAARICEKCGIHLRMNSWDRLELLIDEGTWIPMDEDMVSRDPIEFDKEVFYEKINYKEFLKEFMGYYSKNSVFIEILNNTDKEEDRENDKYCFKCGIDRPDCFEELHEGEISPFQIFFGCAKYDTRDSGFFEECAKKGGLFHFEICWILNKYYKSDEDAFRKFFSKDYEPYFKDDELCSEAFETEFDEKLLGNNAIEIYYFHKSCENICSISPLFYKLFFENRVDLPRLEQFCSKFGIDLSEFFESFPKHEMDCLKFCQEAGSLGIGFSLLSDSCEKQISYDYLDLAFFRKIPKSVSGIYKFLEESYKNELDLFFILDEIGERERFRILSKLSKTFCRYKLGMHKSFEGIAENHKKYLSRDHISFSKDSTKDHIDFAKDSRDHMDHIDPDSRDHMDPDDDFHNPTDLDPDRDSSADSYRDQIDFPTDSKDHIDFARDSRDHMDPDDDFHNPTDLDPDRDSSGDLLGRRDSKDLIHHIYFAKDSRDHMDHIDPDSRDHMDPDDDFQNPTDLDPDRDSSADSSRDQIDFPTDSKDHIDWDEDCRPRTALDPDKDSSGDLLGRRGGNENGEEDGYCQNPTGHDPDKDSSGYSARPMDGISVYKEEEDPLAYIFTDSEDVTYPVKKDISEKENEGGEESAASSDSSGLEGKYYRDHMDLSPKETGLEEISEKDKEGSKKEEESKEEESKESNDLESEFEFDFEFDWDEFIETFNRKVRYAEVEFDFEGRYGSKKEEESKEEESKEEESKEEESKEEESKEEESKEEESKEEESKEEESKESNDLEFEFDEEEFAEFIHFKPEDDEEEDINYIDYYDSYQDETGLPEAIQTGIGELNGIPLAIGVMDFGFIGGSMGAVVGEKITRLIEYATKNSLPLIIVCASGGARMQEGIVSLMQMAKISSALYDYHYKSVEKELLYISILASPTSGGVTASFGMLGDIIIAEPDAEIAFAGKRVIEEVLKEEVPEGAQTTENLFEKGLFDPVLPRNLLKSALSELLELHGFFPLNKTQAKH